MEHLQLDFLQVVELEWAGTKNNINEKWNQFPKPDLL
jgi:hypothetical protein